MWLNLSAVPIEPPLVREFERFTAEEASLFFPELSNFGSPPAEPGVYLNEIIRISAVCIFLYRTVIVAPRKVNGIHKNTS